VSQLTQTPVPLKTLAAVTAGVLLAHLMVLQGTSLAISLNEPTVTRPFITRTIQALPQTIKNVPTPLQEASGAHNAAAPEKQPTAPNNTLSSKSTESLTPLEAEQNAAGPREQEKPQPTDSVAEVQPSTPPTADLTAKDLVAGDAALTAQTFVMPGSMRLKYDVTGGKDGLTYHARAELLWLQDSVNYEARMEVSAFLIGSRTRTSKGRLTEQGLAPDRFSDKYRSELAAHFDRDRGRVTFSNGPEIPLMERAQDQLSLFIQLGAMLAGEPGKYPKGTLVSIQTIGPRAAEIWMMAVEEPETLKLPGGDLATVKLVRNPRREYDQKAEMWLAPSMGYLPVRMRITQPNGDFVDQQWRATEVP